MPTDASLQSDVDSSPSVVARMSIGQKLPLMVGALILIVTAALTAAAYLEVRRSARETAIARLQTVTRRLAEAFRANGRTLPEQARRNAERPEVAAYLRTRDPKLREDALKALQYVGLQPEQVLAVELRDGAGNVLLLTGPAARQVTQAQGVDRGGEGVNGIAGAQRDSFPRPERPDSGSVGEFRTLGDTVFYPVVAAVPGPVRGYVVHWRRVAVSAAQQEQFQELIGAGATLIFGNASGTLWTDLVKILPAPPVPIDSLLELAAYRRQQGGDRYYAVASRIPSVPWLVMLELPERFVLAPAGKFLQRMALIGALFVVTGLFGAWLVSRRITTPLRSLANAAHGIADGDYTRPILIKRSDELGLLADAFRTMTGHVRDSQQRLELKVDERTRELNDALVQLRQAQAALVHRERLALLGQLASGVGHELRNPLGVMSNAIYYLDAVLSTAPPNVKEYLDILRQQVALSERIISHLLEFGRTKPPQREVIPLGTLVEAQIKRLPAPPNVSIERRIPPSLPPVYVDPVQIGQVILNILLNAVQAIGPDGGTITVCGRHDPARGVELDVSDSGDGVAPENLEQIFEPLFTTKARGMGLGLAVSRSLARANDGEITVESPPGRGATFCLTLPAAPTEVSR